MKHLLQNLAVAGGLLVATPQFAQYARFEWAGLYNGSGNSSQTNDAVWSTPGVGHYLVTCGEFTGTMDADISAGTNSLASQGGSDIYIACHSIQNTNLFWTLRIGSTGNDRALVMTRSSDYNLIVGGSFSDTVDFDPGPGVNNLISAGGADGFIMKIDITTGNVLWAVHAVAGPGDEAVTSLGLNQNDVLSISGSFNGTIDLDPTSAVSSVTSAGNDDIYVARYSASGSFVRGTSFGGPDNDLSYDVTTGFNGNAVICGGFINQIDLDPGAGVQQLTSTDTTMFILSLDTNLAYYNHKFLNTTQRGFLIYDPGIYRIAVAGSFKDSINANMSTSGNYIYSTGGYDVFIMTTFEYLNSTVNVYSHGGTGDDILTALGGTYQHCIASGITNSPTFTFSTMNNDTIQQGGSGDDLFAFVIEHTTGNVVNTGLAANGTGSRTADGAATWFGASGYSIWIGGNVSGTCDFDPTASGYSLTSTSSTAEGFALSWSPCATINSQTGFFVCDTVFVHNSVTYPVPSTFYDTLISICGSDSIIRYDLNYQAPPDIGVTLNNFTLTSNASGVTYQWVDCNANYAPIAGAISQSFTPSIDGNYAVIVDNSNCQPDTSACTAIIGIGISEEPMENLQISPNPFSDMLIISQAPYGSVIQLYNILGEELFVQQVSASTTNMSTSHLPPGSYVVRITYNEQTHTVKMVK